ncbi:MAG: hypothetical protein Q4P28_03865 [Tissierellia bacterium]|nr:hypothetical protein [Tissierellia bacterium]
MGDARDLLIHGSQYPKDIPGNFLKFHRVRNPLEVFVKGRVQKIIESRDQGMQGIQSLN